MFPNAKVYHDGSHYIAIPETTAKKKKKAARKPEEEVAVTITAEGVKPAKGISEKEQSKIHDDLEYLVEMGIIDESELKEKPADRSIIEQKGPVLSLSRTEIFNIEYEKNKHLPKLKLRGKLCSALRPYFKNEVETGYFINYSLARVRKNANSRKNRAWKKARLAEFNYFCTFTYDDNKVTEEEFRKKLKRLLANLNYRKQWTYMGVWERGGKTERLHFHALVHVPEGKMVGEFVEVRDYNTEKHCMQTQLVNSYFGERFGRTTFEPIEPQELDFSLNYILKYIEKTGEKIVYSKGLFMYFQSDISDDDVIMKMSNEHPEQRCDKFILFDNFTCMDDGEIIRTANAETIEKMPHCNN